MEGEVEKKGNILLAEDQEDILEQLTKKIGSLGYQIFPAKDGAEALQILKDQRIDLILTDVRMPNIDGLELTSQVKKFSHLPVILFSGFPSFSPEQDIIIRTADALITKPIKYPDLEELILKNLNNSEASFPYIRVNFNLFNLNKIPVLPIYLREGIDKFTLFDLPKARDPIQQLKKMATDYPYRIYLNLDDFPLLLGDKNFKDGPPIDPEYSFGIEEEEDDLLLEGDEFKPFPLNQKIISKLSPKYHLSQLNKETLQFSMNFTNFMLQSLISNNKKFRDVFRKWMHLPSINHMKSLITALISMEYYFKNSEKKGNNAELLQLAAIMFGSIFQDLGKIRLSKNLIELDSTPLDKRPSPKKISKTTEDDEEDDDDLIRIEGHVSTSFEILLDFPFIPKDALEIVLHHHENNEGLGYPMGITTNEFGENSLITTQVSHFFDHCLYTERKEGPEGLKEALELAKKFQGKYFTPAFLEGLGNIFNR
jgi:response regulator RpfG family c-di-GMP phosphodiesterase